jgi:putative tryptophan/tyrosine transport system substrate-binding protein
MNRREFIAGLGSAAAWPVMARAQQPARLPIIGFLGAATPASWSQWTGAFMQRLRELGWIDGRSVAIEYRWAEGSGERAVEIVSEFARLKVDVIVTTGATVLAAGLMPSTIPVVVATSNDPVGSGLIASLARPGGNVTGLSNQGSDIASKRFGLLREINPGLRRLAILVNPGTSASMLEMREVESTARTLGLEVVTSEIRRAEDIAPAFERFRGRTEALYVCSDFLTFTHRVRINTWALALRLPMIYSESDNVEIGALMSYGPYFRDQFRRAADFVDKILRGAKPGDIPFEQPTNFHLAINLTTAKALGLTIPETLLATADEVIQ